MAQLDQLCPRSVLATLEAADGVQVGGDMKGEMWLLCRFSTCSPQLQHIAWE